jgi:hypothetical protein
MDIDVSPSMPVRTLAGNMEQVLRGHALAASLRAHGVTGITFTAPKQTETTQRWKAALTTPGGLLSTRLEFSRRETHIVPKASTPSPELLGEAFLPPFIISHYDADTMAVQKIFALSSPSRVAARDLFDIHHLFSQVGVVTESLKDRIPPAVAVQALHKVVGFHARDFREQVLPFLPEDWQRVYENPGAFDRLKDQIETGFIPLLP